MDSNQQYIVKCQFDSPEVGITYVSYLVSIDREFNFPQIKTKFKQTWSDKYNIPFGGEIMTVVPVELEIL